MASHDQISTLFAEIEKEHSSQVDILIPNAGYGKRIKDIE
jgi:short-subunit dehydrogenase